MTSFVPGNGGKWISAMIFGVPLLPETIHIHLVHVSMAKRRVPIVVVGLVSLFSFFLVELSIPFSYVLYTTGEELLVVEHYKMKTAIG